jgi:hypothetical protein
VKRCREIGSKNGFCSANITATFTLAESYFSRIGDGFADRGPRGAQYSPVFEISKVLTQSIKDFAATSGVTATESSY